MEIAQLKSQKANNPKIQKAAQSMNANMTAFYEQFLVAKCC